MTQLTSPGCQSRGCQLKSLDSAYVLLLESLSVKLVCTHVRSVPKHYFYQPFHNDLTYRPFFASASIIIENFIKTLPILCTSWMSIKNCLFRTSFGWFRFAILFLVHENSRIVCQIKAINKSLSFSFPSNESLTRIRHNPKSQSQSATYKQTNKHSHFHTNRLNDNFFLFYSPHQQTYLLSELDISSTISQATRASGDVGPNLALASLAAVIASTVDTLEDVAANRE